MSTRYGIELVLAPGLPSLIHLARQITYAQFGCNFPDRLPIRITLVPFFEMPERHVPRLESDIARILSGFREGSLSFYMTRSQMLVDEATGSLVLELQMHGDSIFSLMKSSGPKRKKRSLFGLGGDAYETEEPETRAPSHPLYTLQTRIWNAVRSTPGTRVYNPNFQFRPFVFILQWSGLPGPELNDAAQYASSVLTSFDATNVTKPWRIWLVRYSSDAAGEDWTRGRFLSDVTWHKLSSFTLSDD